MELVLNQELEFAPEPTVVSDIKPEGILTSNYKSIVKNAHSRSKKTSLFGIKQRLKASQFNTINHTTALIKLSVFTAIFIALL